MTFESRLAAIRCRFLAALPDRLCRIDALLERVGGHFDSTNMTTLRRECHDLAGTAAMLGLDAVASEGHDLSSLLASATQRQELARREVDGARQALERLNALAVHLREGGEALS